MKNFILFMTNNCVCVLLVLFMCSLQGCMCYYKAQSVNTVTTQEIRKYVSEKKYFILHRDSIFWHLSGIEVNDESLAGNLTADVPAHRWNYEITDSRKAHRYKRKNRDDVLDQVHLYLKDSIVPEIDSGGHIKVALADIKKIEVYQKAKGRTFLSWAIPIVITGAVVVIIIEPGIILYTFDVPL